MRDRTPGLGGPERWEVYPVEDEADALRLARRLVHAPDLFVPGPERPEPEVPGICDCDTAGSPSGAYLVPLLLLFRRRRSATDPGTP